MLTFTPEGSIVSLAAVRKNVVYTSFLRCNQNHISNKFNIDREMYLCLVKLPEKHVAQEQY